MLVFATAFAVSAKVTGRITASINGLDLDKPENNASYEELTPLLSRLKKQNDMIASQLVEFREKQIEFTAITDNMCEGLIILNRYAHILSCNKSALVLFDIQNKNIENQHILVIRQDESFRRVVETALSGGAAETLLPAEATEAGAEKSRLQVFANPVMDGQVVRGAVLLILDVTEHEDREKLRREFSANVSHELKTPLMAISGFAEIMVSGVAKPEDTRYFA